MTILTRTQILNAKDFDTAEVDVPEWGGADAKVLVRELNAAEQDEIGLQAANPDGSIDVRLTKGMRVKMVHWCVINQDGAPMFEEKDVRKLAQKSSKVISRISDKIRELSGLGSPEEGPAVCPKCGTVFEVNVSELIKRAQETEKKTKNE